MRYFKKIQCLFIALCFFLAVTPFKVHAADPVEFKIVGWKDTSDLDGVLSVKINGVELSEYDAATYSPTSSVNRAVVEASSTLSVEIVLKEGYDFYPWVSDGVKLYLGGVESGEEGVTNSKSTTSIPAPSENWHEDGEEFYLYFNLWRNPHTPIQDVTLNTRPIDCGTTISGPTTPSPDVSVLLQNQYKVVPNSTRWLKQEGTDYVEADYPFVTKGGNDYIFKVDVEDVGDYYFVEGIDDAHMNVTVNGGTLLSYTVDRDQYTPGLSTLHATISIPANHIPGDPVKTNIVPPACTETGSHDEVISCSGCQEELSRTSGIIDDAIGHDWGEWVVTEEPTFDKEGTKESICRNDSSHVRTESIPCLESCVVTFDNNGHGTAPDEQRVEVGKTADEPENITAKGYIFGGWYTDRNCTNSFDFDTPITEDITLYAKWTPAAEETTPIKFFQTGDGLNIIPWCALLGLSLTAIAYLEIRKKRCTTCNKTK